MGLANIVHADPNPVFYVRTDRASYSPGDTGLLEITIRNQGNQAMTVKNISITYPWMSFINDHWDGNVTINNIGAPVASGGAAYNTQQSFTVPTDGRAYHFGFGTIRVGTDIGGNGREYLSTNFQVTMNAPTYTPVGISTSLFSILLVGIMAVATFLLFNCQHGAEKLRTITPSTTH